MTAPESVAAAPEEELVRDIAAHAKRSWDYEKSAEFCECGAQLVAEGTPIPAGFAVMAWRHAQHVAGEVQKRLRDRDARVRAEALREVAEEFALLSKWFTSNEKWRFANLRALLPEEEK